MAMIALTSVAELAYGITVVENVLIFGKGFYLERPITDDDVELILFGLEFDNLHKNVLRIGTFFGKSTDSVIRKLGNGLSHFGGKYFY